MLDLESQPLKKKFRAQSRLNQSLASKCFGLLYCWGACECCFLASVQMFPPAQEISCIGIDICLWCPAMPANPLTKGTAADL